MARTDAQGIQNYTFYDVRTLGERLKLGKCQGKKVPDRALHVMDEKEIEQFKDAQETLGTVLLALNWPHWSREDRAALLSCIDALERKLIDVKHASNVQNPLTGIEHPTFQSRVRSR